MDTLAEQSANHRVHWSKCINHDLLYFYFI